MKFHPASQNGNVMVVSLALGTILGGILVSYLAFVIAQDSLSARSQGWNIALAVAEAGIAEALTQVNCTNNLLSNGWSTNGGYYTKTTYLGANYYAVGITNPSAPEIHSTGYVSWARDGTFISRKIKITTQKKGMFMKGLVAKATLSFSGGVQTDSFDSSNPTYSTGGHYDPNKPFKSNGDVGTVSTVAGAISANGGVTLYGHASTGPNGSISWSGNVAIGDTNWAGPGIQSGWTSSDMSYDFYDVSAPFSGGAYTPSGGNIGTTNFTYLLANGNYQLTSLGMKETVGVTGNAVLYVTGSIGMSGNSSGIYIAPGASLWLYCAGASTDLTGQGVMNNNGSATNFYYFGLPSNTSLKLAGNAAFTGVIYAPQADFELKGGGSTPYDLVGAAVVNSVTMVGHFKFHYDEVLKNIGATGGFKIKSWTEM